MNVVLWVLQVLLAAHTAIGAVWKFSNSVEETMPTLGAIPHGVWLGLGAVELLVAAALVVPALSSSLAILAPLAAAFIVFEMLLFSGVHLASGASDHGPMIYWLVVAALAGFVVYGRFVLAR